MLDFFLVLRLAIVVSPPGHNRAIKSGLDPLCLVRLAKARTTTTSRAADMQSVPLHCCSWKLAISPDSANKTRKTGICKNQVTSKMPCTSFSLLNGHTKLLSNILCRCLLFNLQTGFFGILIAGCADFPAFTRDSALKNTRLPCILRWIFVQKKDS